MSQYYFDPFFEALDSSGRSIAGATLQFYENNTTTPKDIFTDDTLATNHPNPITANGAGRFPEIYLNGIYSVQFSDDNNVLIKTIDNFSGALATTIGAEEGVLSVVVRDPLINTGTTENLIIEAIPDALVRSFTAVAPLTDTGTVENPIIELTAIPGVQSLTAVTPLIDTGTPEDPIIEVISDSLVHSLTVNEPLVDTGTAENPVIELEDGPGVQTLTVVAPLIDTGTAEDPVIEGTTRLKTATTLSLYTLKQN